MIFKTFRAMSVLQRLITTALILIVVIGSIWSATVFFINKHDDGVREDTLNEISEKAEQQVKQDEKNIKDDLAEYYSSGVSILDRVLPEEPDHSHSRQKSSAKVYQTEPHASAKGTQLSGFKTDSRAGASMGLHPTSLSFNEITQLLQEEAKTGETCYPEQIINDDGSIGIIDVCIAKNIQK